MNEISQFRFPADIRFGARARSVLAEFARKYRVSRAVALPLGKQNKLQQ